MLLRYVIFTMKILYKINEFQKIGENLYSTHARVQIITINIKYV